MEPLPKVNDAVPGDALIVSCNGVLTHCGIIAIDEVRRFPTFIHSHVGRRGVVEDPLGMWLSSARRGFRFKQIVKVDL